jgi:hypothetical protein
LKAEKVYRELKKLRLRLSEDGSGKKAVGNRKVLAELKRLRQSYDASGSKSAKKIEKDRTPR